MGQIAVGLMVRPPQPGEASHALYSSEHGSTAKVAWIHGS